MPATRRAVVSLSILVPSLLGAYVGACTSAMGTPPGGRLAAQSSSASTVASLDVMSSSSPSSSAVTSSSASLPRPVPGPLPPAYQATAALVWSKAGKDVVSIVSRWVEEKDGEALVVKEVNGAVLATDTSLWALVVRPTTRRGCGCGSSPASPPDPWVQGQLRLVNLSTKTERVLREVKPEAATKCRGDLASYTGRIEIQGVVGTTVLVESSADGMGCMAAHPFYEQGQSTFDVATGGISDKLSPPMSKASNLVEQATAAINAQYGDCVFDESEKAEPFSAVPLFDEAGTLRAHYTFTKGAPYVCGTGPGHYSVATELDSEHVPTAFVAYRQAPRWLARYLARERATVVGVSPVPKGLDATTALQQLGHVPYK